MKPTRSNLLFLAACALFLGSCRKKEASLSLLIFTLSMDEIAVTFFLIGRDNTLPLEINAISTLIFFISVILILIWCQIRARTIGKEARALLERP